MILRALMAFVALPGVVAFAIPALWIGRFGSFRVVHPGGLAIVGVGTVGLLWCVRDFYVRGKGTLAPWSPPTDLVVVGLYRYSRNPMYVCVVLILLGWATSFRSAALLVYCVLIATAFHLRVVYGEEPWLARSYGARWHDYASKVPRWFGLVPK